MISSTRVFFFNEKYYSGASLIRTPLIRTLHLPDDFSWERNYYTLICIINPEIRVPGPDGHFLLQNAKMQIVKCTVNPDDFFFFKGLLRTIQQDVNCKENISHSVEALTSKRELKRVNLPVQYRCLQVLSETRRFYCTCRSRNLHIVSIEFENKSVPSLPSC